MNVYQPILDDIFQFAQDCVNARFGINRDNEIQKWTKTRVITNNDLVLTQEPARLTKAGNK